MGKKKISFYPKANQRAAVMVYLAEAVEKEPIRGIVSSPLVAGYVMMQLSLGRSSQLN